MWAWVTARRQRKAAYRAALEQEVASIVPREAFAQLRALFVRHPKAALTDAFIKWSIENQDATLDEP